MANLTSTSILKSLRGVICVYKPTEVSVLKLRGTLINKIITELNELDKQIEYPDRIAIGDPTPNNNIDGNSENNKVVDLKSFSLSRQLDLRHHPRIAGPKYVPEAFAVSWSNFLGWNTSGVLVFGLKRGTQAAKFIRENLPTRCYQLKCKLGQSTDNGFAHGKVVERSTWSFIKAFHMDRILSATQAAHQKKMFELCGVDIQSQLAYELAVKGPIRPANSKVPIVYGLKCVDFIGPEFTLEVQCVNEYETYLVDLVREIAMKLHTTAHCVSIKCIRHSCFSLEHTLLMKHWNLENIVGNIGMCAELLNKNKHLLDQDSVALRQQV